MNTELNKRLTRLHDEYLAEKAGKSRLARIQRKIEAEAALKLGLLKKFAHKGPYNLNEYFKYRYGDAVQALVAGDSSFFRRLKKSPDWVGKIMEIPPGEL